MQHLFLFETFATTTCILVTVTQDLRKDQVKLIWFLITLLNFILFYRHFWINMGASVLSFIVLVATQSAVHGFTEGVPLFILSNSLTLVWLLIV